MITSVYWLLLAAFDRLSQERDEQRKIMASL